MKLFKIDISFYLLCICAVLSPFQEMFLRFLIVLCLHEAGHLFFIIIFKIKIHRLKLYPFGFFMSIENKNIDFYKDILIYSGGIIFNMIFLYILPQDYWTISILFIVINLLPIFPLDGAMAIRSLLSYFLPYKISLYVSLSTGFIALAAVTIVLIRYFDSLLIINILCLWYISIHEFLCIPKIMDAFMLQRYLNPISKKFKKISFRHNLEQYLFKYHRVKMKVNDIFVEENAILQLKYEGK